MVLSAADVCWPDAILRLRVEGTEEGVDEQAAALAALCGARPVDDAEAAALETSLAVRPWRGEGAVAGLAFPRTRLADVLEAASAFAVEMVVRAPARCRRGAAAGVPQMTLVQPRAAVERAGGHLVLHRGGAAVAAAAWPAAAGPEVGLMRALRRSLDPGGTLAPGRALGDDDPADWWGTAG